jgi:hypothetical protein
MLYAIAAVLSLAGLWLHLRNSRGNPEALDDAAAKRESDRMYLDAGVTPPRWRHDIEAYKAAHPETKAKPPEVAP